MDIGNQGASLLVEAVKNGAFRGQSRFAKLGILIRRHRRENPKNWMSFVWCHAINFVIPKFDVNQTENWPQACGPIAKAVDAEISRISYEYQQKHSPDGVNSQGPILISESNNVKLFGRKDQPIIKGNLQGVLTKPRYDVVFALLKAGKYGLTKDQLTENSKHEDARKILDNLRKTKSDWKSVIRMAKKAGKHYRIL